MRATVKATGLRDESWGLEHLMEVCAGWVGQVGQAQLAGQKVGAQLIHSEVELLGPSVSQTVLHFRCCCLCLASRCGLPRRAACPAPVCVLAAVP